MGSLYERLGGEDAVTAAVVLFYRKVAAAERVARFFEGLDMERQIEKQIAFMTMVFGGPSRYTGRDLAAAHSDLVARGLGDREFDAIASLLRETLVELSIDPALISEVLALVEATRGQVLGRAQ